MASCHLAASHYLCQCWTRSMSPHGVTWPHWVKLAVSQQYSIKQSDADTSFITYNLLGLFNTNMTTKSRRVQSVGFFPVAKDINSILHPPCYLILHRLSYAVTPGKGDISVGPLFTAKCGTQKNIYAMGCERTINLQIGIISFGLASKSMKHNNTHIFFFIHHEVVVTSITLQIIVA